MTQCHNICSECSTKHKQPSPIQVLPQYTCSYCEKNEAQILYIGQPSCLKCQNKLSIAAPLRSTIKISEHGCQSSTISSTNNIQINRKILKSSSQNKIMKKINQLLTNFTFSKSSVSKFKNLIFYWSRENNKDFSWGDFIENIQKKSPIIFVIQVKSQIIGIFMNQNVDKKKGLVQDKHLTCFEIKQQGIEFSQLEKNKFVVRHEKHIICFGSPGSIHILFDKMEVEAEYFKDTLQHPIDQFLVIKI